MTNEYTALAKFYEDIIYDENYKSFMNYIVSLIKDNSLGKVGLDVACGTGILTRLLKRNGFDVTGVDFSQDMLNVAQEKSYIERLNIKYLKEDMKSLKTLNKVDFITVINDGINYIENKYLLKTFKNFYNSLKKGGTLIFDVSSPYKLKNVLGNNAFGDDGEDLSYLWLNSYDEISNSVDISLSIFEKMGDKYIRYNENQIQYLHEIDVLTEILRTVGFELVKINDGFGNELNNKSERILFILKK